MWTLEATDCFVRKQKRYAKDHPRELTAALVNLETYRLALLEGVHPAQLRERHRFVHNERDGVYAIDQKGGGRNLAETRLYLYPDTANKVLWLLTIGDKNTQKRDIQDCRDMLADIPEEGSGSDPAEGDGNDEREAGTDQAGEEGEVR